MKLVLWLFGLLGLIAFEKAGGMSVFYWNQSKNRKIYSFLVFNSGLDLCTLPSASGGPENYCRAAHEKFFFNKETQECEMFTYGGCGGNDNRFNTKAECEERCKINWSWNYMKL